MQSSIIDVFLRFPQQPVVTETSETFGKPHAEYCVILLKLYYSNQNNMNLLQYNFQKTILTVYNIEKCRIKIHEMGNVLLKTCSNNRENIIFLYFFSFNSRESRIGNNNFFFTSKLFDFMLRNYLLKLEILRARTL